MSNELTYKTISIIDILDSLENLEFSIEEFNKTLLSFSCSQNKDIEKFFIENSIQSAKRKQSNTFILYSNKNDILAYYTLAIKTLQINADSLSKTQSKKIKSISEYDEIANMFNIPVYLLAQIGKNDKFKNMISGNQILYDAISKINEAKKIVGGYILLVESVNVDKVKSFYINNNFSIVNIKNSINNNKLIQMIKFLK